MKDFFTGLLAVAVAGVCFTAHARGPLYSWPSLPVVKQPVFKQDTFSVVRYGAKPDGVTLNTAQLNAAISACSAAGGGVVYVPQGVWLTGPLVLKSNVNLHISRSALLLFTADKNQYPLVEGSFEGRKSVRNMSPISGTDLENIAITGQGVIDANGAGWRPLKRDKVTEGDWKAKTATGGLISADGKTWYPSEGYLKGEQAKNITGRFPDDYVPYKDFFRPNFLVLTGCRSVLLQGVTFQNSPAWCLHTLYCEQLTFDGLQIRNEPYAQNGDGIDIESCSYVEVKNCTLDCGDDGICIKSGKDEEGRKAGKASQYIIVRNNTVFHAHGGFVIGSEMSGGVRDVFVSDCVFIGTDIGLRFKTARGRGGVVENIHLRNISMHNIIHDAILFDMFYYSKVKSLAERNGQAEPMPVSEATPQFRNFDIDNLVCEGAQRAILIRGLPEMNIRNIRMQNMVMKTTVGADIIDADGIALKGVTLLCSSSRTPVYIENSRNVQLDSLAAPAAVEHFVSINGRNCKGIAASRLYASVSGQMAEFAYGASGADWQLQPQLPSAGDVTYATAAISGPLVRHIYTADPSAHVFNNRMYIYPSHDTATGVAKDKLASHYDMRDYHVLSMDSVGGKITDHGVGLGLTAVPWALKQLWAPDAAFANNKYYLYFPAKDKQQVFRIGVAVSQKPEGPFVPEKNPIEGSYSIDPCIFADSDGAFYMYFGGIKGGQLQLWNNNVYNAAAEDKAGEQTALLPRIARLSKDMKHFNEPVKEVILIDSLGRLFKEQDDDKRFFEGAWVFKKEGVYYLTYSTGNTHKICYATAGNPYGPFTYRGVLLQPVKGWTTHPSVVCENGKWYLFFHDTELSGETHLRNIKVTPLTFRADGSIVTIQPNTSESFTGAAN